MSSTRFYITGIILLFLTGLLPPETLEAQNSVRLELLHADELRNVQQNDKNVQILSGDIWFRRGDYLMFCEHARRYEATDISIFRDNVRVYGKTDTLWADSLVVYNKRDLIVAYGHPELYSGERTIRGNVLRYDMKAKTAEASGNVEMQEPDHYVEADSVWYSEDSNQAKIFGKKRFATVIDESRQVKIQGPLITQNLKTEYLEAQQRPVLVKLDSANNEVVRITGNVVHGYPDSGRYEAEDEVIITRDKLRAETSKAVFHETENYARLENSPTVWYEDNTITGDAINVYFHGNALERVFIPANAKVHSKTHGYQRVRKGSIPDSIKTTHEYLPAGVDTSEFALIKSDFTDDLQGSQLRIWFNDGNIDRIRVTGMAQSAYHVFEDSLYQGLNETSGDTIRMQFAADSLERIDVIGGTRGTFTPGKYNTSADTTIFYESDQIQFLVPQRITYLKYNADTRYKDMELTAAFIDVYWTRNLLVATPLPASADTTGTERNRPTFLQKGKEPMIGNKLEYNLKTKQGRVTHGETDFQDGRYVGQRILKEGENTLYVQSGEYTTCDLPEPHYHFESRQMKLILKDKVIARPIILYIHGVPIFGLPFGVFPQKGGKRASGYIMPSYGESARDGRYLSGLGYFWAPSQYWDYRILFSFWDARGITLQQRIRYNKRYRYSGNIGFTYDKMLFKPSRTEEFEINVRHSQTIDPTTSLNVNGSYVSSRQYYRRTSLDLQDRLNQQVRSNATLNKRWDNLDLSMTANLSRTENLQNGNVNETIPRLSFRRGTNVLIKPPDGASASEKSRWYYNLNYDYSANLENSHSHTLIQSSVYTDPYGRRIDLGQDSTYVDETRRAIRHSASLQAPVKFLKYISLTPRLSLNEDWVPAYREPVVVNDTIQVDSTGNVRFRKINQFRARHTFTFSTGAQTKLYGLFNIPFGPVSAIRHVMTPSISYNIGPDFSKRRYGYYFYGIMPDSTIGKFDRFAGTLAGGTGSRETQSMRISLQNLFQAKYYTTENGERKENKIDFLTWNISTGYNFAATEHKWSSISSSMRASLGNKLSLDISMTHSPYKYKTNKLIIPRLTNLSLSTGFNLSGKRFTRSSQSSVLPPDSTIMQLSDTTSTNAFNSMDSLLFAPGAPQFGQGQDFWTLRMNLRYSVDKTNPENPRDPTFWLNTNGKFNLSKNWAVSINSRFDLINREVVNTSISIHRDLHCWEMSFQWEPTGYTRGYYLKINVKSPNLQDLKLESRGGRYNQPAF